VKGRSKTQAVSLEAWDLHALGGRLQDAAWKQCKSQLPEWMSSQLDNWQEEVLALNAKERKVRQELEQMVTENLPTGSRKEFANSVSQENEQ
jgi:hypothetical protein